MTNILDFANVSLCPERVEYRKFINDEAAKNLDPKEYKEIKKALLEKYKLALHNYFAEVYPHLLYEKTNDKTYWNYSDTDGTYYEMSFAEVRNLVIKLLINEDLLACATETFTKLILNRYRAAYDERGVLFEDFNCREGWLHVKNGWLNLETKELQAHSPDYLSLFKMETAYEPEAVCPLYDKFLDEDTQMAKDQIRVIDQFSGYVLTDGIEQHTCLILEGRKGCGKSTLIEIWMDMLGTKAIPLQLTSLQNGGERFIGPTLAHKNLCWFDEANPRTSNINEFFQNLITGAKIRIERKGIQSDDYVNNKLKIVLSLNEMPDHMPPGMDRRYRHIVFSRSFYEEGIVDTDYKKRVLESERSGVLNRMLRGLDDLRKMGRMTMIAGEEDRKREYTLTSDDFSSFLSDHFEPTPVDEGVVRYSYEQMKNAFVSEYPKSYNKQLSVRGFNKKLLTTRLPEFKNIGTGKSGSDRGYKGLRLKDGHNFSSNNYDPIICNYTPDPNNF